MITKKDVSCWYVFYCKSRTEKKALDILLNDGYHAYLPLVEEKRKWSDRIKKVHLPLFSGYIFVNCLFKKIYEITQYNYIVAPVKIGNEFAILKQKEIDLLRIIEQNGIYATVESEGIGKGDKVIVVDGPLKGQEGVCIYELGKSHLLVEIKAIGKGLKINIHSGALSKKD